MILLITQKGKINLKNFLNFRFKFAHVSFQSFNFGWLNTVLPQITAATRLSEDSVSACWQLGIPWNFCG